MQLATSILVKPRKIDDWQAQTARPLASRTAATSFEDARVRRTKGKMRVCSLSILILIIVLAAACAAQAQLAVDPRGDANLHSGSQPTPSAQSIPLFSWHDLSRIDKQVGNQVTSVGSISVEVPRFSQNIGAGFGDTSFQPVNLDWHLERTEERSTQALPFLHIANTPSQIGSDSLAETNSPDKSGADPAPSQSPDPYGQGFHVAITPYLWFAGVHGTVGALGHQASVHASFSDIFSHFNIGLTFALEPRYNRIVMPLDFMWMKVSDDEALPAETGVTSVKVKVNQIMLTQKIGYRVIDNEKLKVDGLVGFRYWHMGNTLTLEPQIANDFYEAADWVDVVAGAKIQAPLSPKLLFTILGDAGGGGANSDYQVAALLGWKLKKFVLTGGWRYLSVNYRPSGSASFIYNMNTSGLILGATIPLK